MFNDEAEEAIQLYTSLFEDSEIITMVSMAKKDQAHLDQYNTPSLR